MATPQQLANLNKARAGRKPVPDGESKSARFSRVAEKRVTDAIRAMRRVSILADRARYEATPEQAEAILRVLAGEFRAMEQKFTRAPRERAKVDFKFPS